MATLAQCLPGHAAEQVADEVEDQVQSGDALRGAALAASRAQGLCVLCHALPGVPSQQSGTLGPDLAGVGSRFSIAQLRERLEAPERFNPDSIMPSVVRRDGLTRVALSRQGQPMLDAQQVDDLLAYLAALR
jgi:sulfur-oxidizing protein SoxX